MAVTAFVDALALSGVTLVAQDWGGPIGIATVEQPTVSGSCWQPARR